MKNSNSARASATRESASLRNRGFSAEFLLTVACCRWPPSADRDAAVRSAAANIVNWNGLLPVVRRQRVAGLVNDALASAGIACPADVADTLGSWARRIARRNLNFAAETVRLQRALEAAGIPALALKGVALAQLAYGSLKLKQTQDIDLLVPPDRAEPALRLLQREGYALSHPATDLSDVQFRAVLRNAREVQLLHRDKKMRLELQWRSATNPLLLNGVDANSATQSVTLADGTSVVTLAPDDLFAYLCVHGAQHAWSRLKWLADLNALISAAPADTVRLYRHAQAIGAGFCAGQALLLCDRLFSRSLPAALANDIEGSARLGRLLTVALKTMTDKYAEAAAARGLAGTMRVAAAQFLLGRGWSFFATQCRVEATRVLDVVDLPLPPSLYFLYPFLRLPLWLWRRAKSAVTRLHGR